jgi:hypothetical protein
MPREKSWRTLVNWDKRSMPQAQEEDTTRWGYFGNKFYVVTICNGCWKDHVRTMLNSMEWILFPPYEMANLRDQQFKECCHELCRKPLARNDRFCFQNLKMWFGTLVSYPRKTFVKTSKVDQELECEMHQTKYKVMIGCDMDLRPMTTTHIVHSCYEEWWI